MHRFKSILFVPLGRRDNPAAVRRVARLASESGAALTVLGIVTEPSGLLRLRDHPRIDRAVAEAQQAALVERLEECCEQIDHQPVTSLVQSGYTPLAIIEQVLAGDHDLVVVTSDEDREDHATIKRLLRKCPAPVWVIRPTRARTQRILAAVNVDPAERELNLEILSLASTLHTLFGGELHVVHGWELYGEATLRNSAFIHTTPAEVDALLEAERAHHQGLLDELVAEAGGGDDWNLHLVKGRPADLVTDLVSHKRINLLVMGTVARTGIAGLLVGNTAEQLLDDVRCSVVAVKPPGFVSPVAPR